MTDDERDDLKEIIRYKLKGGCWCDCRACSNACDGGIIDNKTDGLIDILILFFKKQSFTSRLQKLVTDFEEAVEKEVYRDD